MNNYFMGQDGFNWFVGIVEDRADPDKAGRVRVRCLGYHTSDIQKIPMEDLPWASVMMPVTAGANSGIGFSPHFLLEGTWVVGFFRDLAKQEPVIIGALPGVNTEKTTDFTIASSSAAGGQSLDGGFKDPNAKYPTELYLGIADTNLLAQESVDTHASKDLKHTLTADWTTSTGTAKHPASTQSSAKYPTNHVFETESGHYVEFDDTAGNERIHLFHKKGTYIEIDSSGNVIIKTVGNVTNIVAGNMDIYVEKNYNLSVGGTTGIWSGGLVTELFDAGRKTTITGTETLEISGAVENTFKDKLTLEVTKEVKNTFKDKLTEEVTMDVKQDYKVNLTTTIGALGSIKASAAMVVGGSSISFN